MKAGKLGHQSIHSHKAQRGQKAVLRKAASSYMNKNPRKGLVPYHHYGQLWSLETTTSIHTWLGQQMLTSYGGACKRVQEILFQLQRVAVRIF
jgi:hypothetical protein